MTWKDEIKKEDSAKKLDSLRFFLKQLSLGKKYTARSKLKIGEEAGVGDALMGLHHKAEKEIKKGYEEIEELEDYAGDILRYAMNELKIPDKKIEAVLKTALDIREMNRGEAEEERRADRRHMSLNER